MQDRCGHCGASIEGSADHRCARHESESSARTVPVPAEARPDSGPAKGTVLAGRWVLLEKVGEGSGGMVYLAFDHKLNVQVALKVLPRGAISEQLGERLKREIRIARDIDHPNVSRVFDLGESDGLTFLTMRWIEGEPLHRRVDRTGPLDARDLHRLARGLVGALAAAHRLGVVHRDVKPANVMISTGGEPVLVDFGIATDRGSSASAKVRRGLRITGDGLQPGTPKYMAPELQDGDPATPASDLYSLALTLAYAVTGVAARPEEPERTFAPLGRDAAQWFARCLDPEPQRRPKDAVVLHDALSRAEGGRRSVRGIVALVAVLLVGVAFAWTLWPSPDRVPSIGERPLVAVLPLENRTGDPALEWLEHGVADLVRARLESSGGIRLGMDAADAAHARRIGGRVIAEGGGVAVILELVGPDGRVQMQSRVPNATGDALFAGVDASVREMLAGLGVPPRPTSGATPIEAITKNAEALARYEHAREHLRSHRNIEALEDLRAAVARDPSFALAHLERHVLLATGGLGSVAEAEAALRQAQGHRSRLPSAERELLDALLEIHEPGSDRPRLDRLRAFLRSHPPDATTYRMAARVPTADRIAILQEWAARMPGDPEPHNLLGYQLMMDGDPTRAEREFLTYLAMVPAEANAHDSYGDFLREQDRLEEAQQQYARALQIDPRFASAAIDSVEVALRADDLSAAFERLEAARPLASSESPYFPRWVGQSAAVPLLAADLRGTLRVLDRIAQDPPVGSRAYVAREYEAIVRALSGDLEGARRATDDAERLCGLFHGSAAVLGGLRPYVAALGAHARGNPVALDRALLDLGSAPASPHPELDESRRTLVAGLAAIREGPSVAAARLLDVPPLHQGTAFLAALERARLLVRAGHVAEAGPAYDEAIARRQSATETPEAAFAWRACLSEAARLARDGGDLERAAALEARLAALSERRARRPP